MAQGDIVKRFDAADLIRTCPVPPKSSLAAALVAAANKQKET